jgi:hypothetical protein
VRNRKEVSHRIKEVYEALNMCDDFCTHITNARTVDVEFLQNIRMLESKVAFLADNADLEDTAVHADFTPKLEAAAERAGDKLHKYLLGKLSMLGEDNANVALIQQAVEQQGQYALAFLTRYNPPIAQDITEEYVRLMADVYTRHMKPIGRTVEEIRFAAGNQQLELLITSDSVAQFIKPGGGAARRRPEDMVAVQKKPFMSMSHSRQPSRSISMSIGAVFNRVRGKQAERRVATFADNVNALRSVDVSYRLVVMDPTLTITLVNSTCWVHSFSELYCRLVNNVLNEGRFVDHFFFSAGGTSEQEENMLHLVLDRSMQTLLHVVLSEVPAILDVVALLCAARALEIFRNFVTQSADPMPVLVMQDVFDRIGAAMDQRLAELLAAHEGAVANAATIDFPTFPALPAQAQRLAFAEVLAHDTVLAGRCGVHDIIRRYAGMAGQMIFTNALQLEGSRVDRSQRRLTFSEPVASTLQRCQAHVLTMIDRLAARHSSPVAAAITKVANIGALIMGIATTSIAGGGDGAAAPNVAPPTSSRTFFEELPALSAAALARQRSMLSDDGADAPVATNAQHTADFHALQRRLKEEAVRLVQLDLSANGASSVVPLVDLADRCRDQLGAAFFAADDEQQRRRREGEARDTYDDDGAAGDGGDGGDDGGAEDAAEPDVDVDALRKLFQFSEAEVLGVVATFHKGWQESVGAIYQTMRLYFADSGDDLARFAAKEYYALLMQCNRRIRRVVSTFFPRSGVLQAKIVGDLPFAHEVNKHVSAAAAPGAAAAALH